MRHKLSPVEVEDVEQTLRDLTEGADALASDNLPKVDLPNSTNMLELPRARAFTDNLATFVKAGTMIGPLQSPPWEDFRINQLFCVEQTGKIRPILNLSAPAGDSFNDSINKLEMPKVKMATAKLVSQAIIRKGRGCWLSKCDQIAAYKAIPIRLNQLRLQGFRWLSKLFIEAFLVFGAASSVPNYDRFHRSIIYITLAIANPEPDSLFHCLDDAIFVSSTRQQNKALVDTYRKVGELVNMSLASEEDLDKAFSQKQVGKILGITFNTLELTWSLDEDKVQKFSFTLQSVLRSSKVSQTSLMSVLGTINTIITLARNLRFFRNALITDISRSYTQDPLTISNATRLSIQNWLRIIQQLREGLPLYREPPLAPPIGIITFTTDAAGLKRGGQLTFRIGAGAVQTCYPDLEPIQCIRALWPVHFITNTFDYKDAFSGSKSTTLEMLATILPIYHNIHIVARKAVLIRTDNKAVTQAFESGRCSKDGWASLLLESLMLVANTIPFQVFMVHTRRCSDVPAKIADTLSRSDKKGLQKTASLGILEDSGWPPAIQDWMESPSLDPTLPFKLLQDFQTQLGKLHYLQYKHIQS